jgi:hypothetical protein
MNFADALLTHPAALACIIPALGLAILAIWHRRGDLLSRLSLRLALLAVVIDLVCFIKSVVFPILDGIISKSNFHVDAMALGMREGFVELVWVLSACGFVTLCNLVAILKRR